MGACCAACAPSLRTLALVPRGELADVVGLVTDAEVNALDRAINALDVDVRGSEMANDHGSETLEKLAGWDKLPGAERGAKLVAWNDFVSRWHNFLGGGSGSESFGWRAWIADSAGVLDRATGDEELARWTSKYDQARRAWLSLGFRTSAPVIGPGGDEKGPLDVLGVPHWILYAALGIALLAIVTPGLVQVLAIRRLSP